MNLWLKALLPAAVSFGRCANPVCAAPVADNSDAALQAIRPAPDPSAAEASGMEAVTVASAAEL